MVRESDKDEGRVPFCAGHSFITFTLTPSPMEGTLGETCGGTGMKKYKANRQNLFLFTLRRKSNVRLYDVTAMWCHCFQRSMCTHAHTIKQKKGLDLIWNTTTTTGRSTWLVRPPGFILSTSYKATAHLWPEVILPSSGWNIKLHD